MMNDDRLDDLLNKPLAAIADDGFSARVIARARRKRLEEEVPLLAAAFICLVAVLVFAPLPQITAILAHAVTGTVALPAVSLAVAALVLTFTVERALAQR